jgi:3-oxoacyl-[acyl-carrier-protein] synthase III
MAIFSVPGIRISGIAACVPKTIYQNINYKWIPRKEREQLIKLTGVEQRRIANIKTTTSDLCFAAAEKLIKKANWDKTEIQILVFVSQSRDYPIPSTSCILQDRLGLPKSCMTLDINLGCSGYVYGLSVISSIMKSSGIKKGLFLVGDISSRHSSYKDKSTYPLFGDAGTATLIEPADHSEKIAFNLQSDGSGFDAIIIHDGGMKNNINRKSFDYKKISPGIYRNGIQLALDGIKVFNFALSEVTPNIYDLLNDQSVTIDTIDFFLFHQANLLINNSIRKKLKLPVEKVPITINKFGNTSCASIPLTIVSELQGHVNTKKLNLLLCGFGIGLSWGTVLLTTDKIICPEVIELVE